MTAQYPHEIENRHPTVTFGDLYLYQAIRATQLQYHDYDGQPIAFALPVERLANAPMCSALWAGYIDRFVLNADGTLDHIGYAHLAGINDDASFSFDLQDGTERVTGDFFLEFRTDFFGSHTYVPFVGAHIVTDIAAWIVVKPPGT
ncbi:hypothetical protein RSSM_06667 [Rhodopirellula sallentina SM41]|uniref:Uncharacterized protein n=1 Tax=Rhodopirellula sallentina SM41 TaxID=1263870 RepID=M5TRW0_9BACT|nr:hypothetical protein RSSM_06667 [Rhodopirellula sallentina SM41]